MAISRDRARYADTSLSPSLDPPLRDCNLVRWPPHEIVRDMLITKQASLRARTLYRLRCALSRRCAARPLRPHCMLLLLRAFLLPLYGQRFELADRRNRPWSSLASMWWCVDVAPICGMIVSTADAATWQSGVRCGRRASFMHSLNSRAGGRAACSWHCHQAEK